MYIALMGTAAQGSGPAALAVSLTNNAADQISFEGVIGEDFPISTSAGEIDLSATASGGDGSYSYAWSITEQGDDNNINTGNVRVTDAGTTNQATYDDVIVTGYDTGLSIGDPPIESRLIISCTVTDGTGATASAFERVIVLVLAM